MKQHQPKKHRLSRVGQRIASELSDRSRSFLLCAAGDLPEQIQSAVSAIYACLRAGGKVLIFGNGGSAAEAQHFAAELVGRFERDRKALAALALTTDSSILTAQANDSGYASVFSRQIEALARPGDLAVGMTTSDVSAGHSENIRNGFIAARKAGCKTIGLFSERTRKLLAFIDVALIVPSRSTSIIQEAHLAILHIMTKLVEETSHE